MDEMKIEVEKRPAGVLIFRLAGPLILNTLFEFQDRARSEAGPVIVLDLSEVSYMDSAGLGAMLGVLASCQRHGRGFGITGVNDRIRTLFKVTKVDGMIPVFDSVASAEAQLVKAAGA